MRIVHLSSVFPDNEYTTEELIVAFPCELPEGVKQNVLNLGVSKRSLVCPTTPSTDPDILTENGMLDLCTEACRNAMEKAGIKAGDTGYFIAAYDANPVLSPGLSQLLIRQIGLDPYVKHVNAQGTASTAFPKALQLAEDHLSTKPNDHVLVCVSGISSFWFQNQVNGLGSVMEINHINRMSDEKKRREELKKWMATMEYFLFGDGAAAVVVANHGKGLSVRKTIEVTNVIHGDSRAGYATLSTLSEPFSFGFHSHLDKDIPRLGVAYSDLALNRLLGEESEMTKSVRKWAVHTGSQKILKTLAEHHGIDASKIEESHSVLREHGNLAGASLPCIIEKITEKCRLAAGEKVLMLGYGWGFSAAASLLEA